MKKVCIVFAAVALMLGLTAQAQNTTTTAPTTVIANKCGPVGGSASVAASGQTSVFIQLTGSTNTTSSYQPQQSLDNVKWYNVGTAITNVTAAGKIYHGPAAPYTRIYTNSCSVGLITGVIAYSSAPPPLGWKDLSSGTAVSVGLASVGLTMPADLTVAGSPLTSDGTLAVTRAVQNKNKFLLGPASGADAAPAYRLALVADLPAAMVMGPTGTGLAAPHFVIATSAAMSSGVVTVTLSGAAVFTSNTSYKCSVNPQLATTDSKTLGVTYTSGSVFVVTSADNTDTATVSYICVGN